jgi:hypothetical protein
MIRGIGTLVPILAFLAPVFTADAATASGRHWQIAIESIACESAQSLVVLGARIRYLGPRGPVEAPVNRLVDGKGKAYPPKSLVWHAGSRELAQWLPAGGIVNVQSALAADVQLKFEVAGAAGALQLEFGDVPAFALAGKGGCRKALRPDQLRLPSVIRTRHSSGPRARVYRAVYPCRTDQGKLRNTEAQYPPYLPRQMLVFGRGYLPSARQIELPMGWAPAQAYAYAGLDALDPLEDAARRAIATDFPLYSAGLVGVGQAGSPSQKHFAFNWGSQRAESGNEAYAIAIYDLRGCT